MNESAGTPIEVWEDEEQDFGAGDGSISKKGKLWNVEGGAKGPKEVGEVQRTDVPTTEGSAAVTLILHLNGEEFPEGTIVSKGGLPYRDGKIESGLLAITGGTGGHVGIRGVMRVDVWNPKKYSVQTGG
jgi:hypothetical protein